MKPSEIGRLKKWFSGYVAGFYGGDERCNFNYRLKEEHTRGVCANMVRIAETLKLSPVAVRLAETAALLHDLGRFRQYAVYGSYNDRISENHARLGLKEITRHKVLAGIEPSDRYLITKAIALHNVPVLPDLTDERTRLYARLLRDADKLDIWRVFAEYFYDREKQRDQDANRAITMGLPDSPACSAPVLAAFQKGKNASMGELKTLNDYKLMLISWVFDLNFFPSFQILRERNDVGRIAATLPASAAVLAALDRADRHVRSRSTDHFVTN